MTCGSVSRLRALLNYPCALRVFFDSIAWVKVDDCNYGTVPQLIENQRAISLAIQATKRPMVIQMGGFVFPLLYNPHVQV